MNNQTQSQINQKLNQKIKDKFEAEDWYESGVEQNKRFMEWLGFVEQEVK